MFFSRPGEITMKTRMLAVGGAIALSLAASSAQAATCAGAPPFTDVSASATYCTNTEWLANRGVTLGCVGTNFCPNDPVTRASMALFMNRLADALVLRPVRIQQYLGAFTLTTGAVDNAICQQDVLAAANYPRSISMTTHLSARSAGGVVTMAIQPIYSTDGGATWTFPNTYGSSVGFDAAYTGHVTSPATFTLGAGVPLRVAVGAFSDAGATGIAAGGTCFILVHAQSLSGTASPFDDVEDQPGVRPEGS
jgi:hypothetical protein